jgi:hypothetical protein
MEGTLGFPKKSLKRVHSINPALTKSLGDSKVNTSRGLYFWTVQVSGFFNCQDRDSQSRPCQESRLKGITTAKKSVFKLLRSRCLFLNWQDQDPPRPLPPKGLLTGLKIYIYAYFKLKQVVLDPSDPLKWISSCSY